MQLSITISTDELADTFFNIHGLDFEHGTTHFYVLVEIKPNGSPSIDEYTAIDPTNQLTDDNLTTVLAKESEEMEEGFRTSANVLLNEFNKALLLAVQSKLDGIGEENYYKCEIV